MKVLVIEDEALAARDLVNLLMRLDPHINVLDTLSSVQQAKRWFSENNPPELILSDIQLADGTSFEIFEALHLHCPVIFTTAYDEYAIRAFKLNSIDYLLKPIDIKELEAAFLKYKSLSPENVLGEQLKSLMNQWGSDNKRYKERFLTLHRNNLVPVTQQEVAFFHKEELIYLCTMANEKLISEHQTMDEIESLINPEVFFRVNRQYIIHIQTVGSVKTTTKGLTVHLKSPFRLELDISREKATAFKRWLG